MGAIVTGKRTQLPNTHHNHGRRHYFESGVQNNAASRNSVCLFVCMRENENANV